MRLKGKSEIEECNNTKSTNVNDRECEILFMTVTNDITCSHFTFINGQ